MKRMSWPLPAGTVPGGGGADVPPPPHHIAATRTAIHGARLRMLRAAPRATLCHFSRRMCCPGEKSAQGRNRTTDTGIFSPSSRNFTGCALVSRPCLARDEQDHQARPRTIPRSPPASRSQGIRAHPFIATIPLNDN